MSFERNSVAERAYRTLPNPPFGLMGGPYLDQAKWETLSEEYRHFLADFAAAVREDVFQQAKEYAGRDAQERFCKYGTLDTDDV